MIRLEVVDGVRRIEKLSCAEDFSPSRLSTSGTERFDANEKATRQQGGLLFKGE